VPFPVGIVTREVTIGIPFGLADGEQYAMQVTFTPDRALVWAATGDPGIPRPKTITTSPGVGESVALPVTDQAGYRDRAGAISVANGAQAFLYRIEGEFQDGANRRIGAAFEPYLMALPAEDLSPVDLDLQVPFTGENGQVVEIPDYASLAARVDALEGGSGGGGTGGTTGLSVDTDGVPYFSSAGTSSVALDTDGVPYIAA